MTDLQRIRDILGDPGLARLMQRLTARLGRGDALNGVVTLHQPSQREREAVGRLLGRRPSRTRSVRVPLPDLDQVIRNAELGCDLRAAVEALKGPCIDELLDQRELRARWDSVWKYALTRSGSQSELVAWVEGLHRDGTLRRLARSDPAAGMSLLKQAFEVLDHLPCADMLLAELAALRCGNSHALDNGEPLSTIVLRALAAMRAEEPPADPSERRTLWERFGVVCDELSAPVLVLNLRGDKQCVLGRALHLHADAGEPYRVSSRQLLREGDSLRPEEVGHVVCVCENVTVLAAAATRFGASCPPLVCIDGHPKTAARLLLDRLQSAGTRVLYHGDFDWAGIAITNLLISRHGVEPIRMSVQDYEAFEGTGMSLTGQPVDACWDSRLSAAMVHRGIAIHEELVMNDLFDQWFSTAGLQPRAG